MYVIVREHKEKRTGEYSEENPEFRRSFEETREAFEKVHPRDLSAVRRMAIKKMRMQGKKPELVAEAAAIRECMEKEINR